MISTAFTVVKWIVAFDAGVVSLALVKATCVNRDRKRRLKALQALGPDFVAWEAEMARVEIHYVNA